jgi:hypothetical protein
MKRHLLTLVSLITISTFSFAQEVAKEEAMKSPWTRTVGIGIDAGQLAVINPRIGSGENRVNLGGAASFALNYKKGRYAWDNGLVAIFAVQRSGSGVAPIVGAVGNFKKPFQKSTDEFRLNSKFGYGIKEGGKWFVAADLGLLTQLSPTFGLTDGNNYLTDVQKKGINDVKSQFLSPGIMTLALGIDYKPTPKLSLFYSPISFRGVIVQNSTIAAREAQAGTKVNVFGVATDKNSLFDLGSLARAVYTNKFLKDKLVVNSNLGLFGAYKSGKGVKVDWANQFAFEIFKGFQLGLNVNVLYDKNILVQVTDRNGVNGVQTDATGKPVLVNNKPSIIQQLLLKYAKTF